MNDFGFGSGKRGRKVNGSNHLMADREKARRREEGEARNYEWRALTDKKKVKELLRRPGQCRKQLAKLGFKKDFVSGGVVSIA